MQINNDVECQLASQVTAGDATITVTNPSAPFNLPAVPDSDPSIATLVDSMLAPTKIEIVTYTGLTDNADGTHTLTGVTRAQEGTADQTFSTGTLIQAPTAGIVAWLVSKITLEFARSQNQQLDGPVDLATVAEPPAGASNIGRIFAFDQNGRTRLKYINGAGVVTDLTSDNHAVVRNTTGSTMTTGTVVYVSGQTGAVPEVSPAKADSKATLPAFAVLMEDIADNAYGLAMKVGIVEDFDTSAYPVGTLLYVSESTAGAFTSTRPAYPNYAQPIGKVIVSGVGNGALAVNVPPHLGGQESGTDQPSFKIQGNEAWHLGNLPTAVQSVDGKTGVVDLSGDYEKKRQNNLTATTDPAANDDAAAGYEVLSRWVNTSSGEFFICIDATNGAAVWEQATLTLDELGSAALVDTGTGAGNVPTITDADARYGRLGINNEWSGRQTVNKGVVAGDGTADTADSGYLLNKPGDATPRTYAIVSDAGGGNYDIKVGGGAWRAIEFVNAVAIGKSGPITTLEIQAGDATTYGSTSASRNLLRISNSSLTDESYAAIDFAVRNAAGSFGNAHIAAVSVPGESSAELAFQVRDAGVSREAMRIGKSQDVTFQKQIYQKFTPHALTDVTASGQTRTIDVANGPVQTLNVTATGTTTINVTGPSGKAASVWFYVYNSSGGVVGFTEGSNIVGVINNMSAPDTGLHEMFWDGRRLWTSRLVSASGDLRPT